MHPAQKLALLFGTLWFVIGSYVLLIGEASVQKAIFGASFMIATTVFWLYLTGVLKHWFKDK